MTASPPAICAVVPRTTPPASPHTSPRCGEPASRSPPARDPDWPRANPRLRTIPPCFRSPPGLRSPLSPGLRTPGPQSQFPCLPSPPVPRSTTPARSPSSLVPQVPRLTVPPSHGSPAPRPTVPPNRDHIQLAHLPRGGLPRLAAPPGGGSPRDRTPNVPLLPRSSRPVIPSCLQVCAPPGPQSQFPCPPSPPDLQFPRPQIYDPPAAVLAPYPQVPPGPRFPRTADPSSVGTPPPKVSPPPALPVRATPIRLLPEANRGRGTIPAPADAPPSPTPVDGSLFRVGSSPNLSGTAVPIRPTPRRPSPEGRRKLLPPPKAAVVPVGVTRLVRQSRSLNRTRMILRGGC